MKKSAGSKDIHSIIGGMPYRMAFAGGWIDQPFVSVHNPEPPGAMVVVALEPTFPFMSKCGMGTSTRQAAMKLWGEKLPIEDPQILMRELYQAENANRKDPSGSQDMAGIVFPGINRLDYDADFEGGYFPVNVASHTYPGTAHWLESVIHILPVGQRPHGYYPLGEKNLDEEWISQLGQAGRDCYDAILAKDAESLGESMNETMRCWEAILPHTVRHATITEDLPGLLSYYQENYYGAMYSGCGGGYFYIVSDDPVPGTFQVKIRIPNGQESRDG